MKKKLKQFKKEVTKRGKLKTLKIGYKKTDARAGFTRKSLSKKGRCLSVL